MDALTLFIAEVLNDPERRSLLLELLKREGFHADDQPGENEDNP